MTGDKDNGKSNLPGRKFGLKIESAEPRKPNVEDQATWRVRAFAVEKLQRRLECAGLEAH
jgi:hypothetical protein